MPIRSRTTTTVVLQYILDNSLLLVTGAVVALVWANADIEHYTRFTRATRFVVNDIGMVFFFALATKEVYEATLPGGPLSSGRQAAVPVLAAIGGMVVPASIYAVSVWLAGRRAMRGWAIPCATDIAFSYLVARFIFRTGHPAIPFLLLLAIADDALGLLVLAIFYPSGALALAPLFGFLGAALALALLLRRWGVESFWLYIFGPGALSWVGLHLGGIHPALAMVPIVPMMPHYASDLKLLGRQKVVRLATLQLFEQWWKVPVQVILLAFGLVNAGVPLTSVGLVTWIVMGSLMLGKPLGIVLTTVIADLLGFKRTRDLDFRALTALGIAAGIGFTVALFFTTAAFPPGPALDEAKMGALLSFFGGFLAFGVGRALGIRRT